MLKKIHDDRLVIEKREEEKDKFYTGFRQNIIC